MCAELLRIPVEFRGIPIFGFGLLLVLWLAGAAWAAYRNKRQGRSIAEGWLSVAFGAAAIILLPRFFPDGFPLRGYGLMLLTGSVTGLAMAIYRGRQNGIEPERILSLAMAMFICGIAGARLFYVIEYWESRILQPTVWATLKEALSYTEGGLVVYGSLIGAAAAFLWFCARCKLPPLALADLIAPSLVAGLAFGRIGCLLNGCCYGGETDAPYGVTFPRWSITPAEGRSGQLSGAYLEQYGGGAWIGLRMTAGPTPKALPVVAEVVPNSPAAEAGLQPGMKVVGVNGLRADDPAFSAALVEALLSDALRTGGPLTLTTAAGKTHRIDPGEPPPRSRPVHATQIYSSINAALLAWVLWSLYPLRRTDGQVTAVMLTAYPIARYLLEEIRIDESPVFGTGLSISQNISLVLLAGAALLWIWLCRRGKQRYVFAPACGGSARRQAAC